MSDHRLNEAQDRNVLGWRHYANESFSIFPLNGCSEHVIMPAIWIMSNFQLALSFN